MAIELMSPIHTSQVAFQALQRPVVEPKAAPATEIQHTVTQMNTLSQVINHRLTFSVDHDTNDIIVKVIDADTEKVIREMPAVELQKLHKSIKDAVGLLINKLI
jgi:flagellar protein FlaG